LSPLLTDAGVTSTHRRPTDEELAGWLIAAVLSHHQAEIEPDKLAWLRCFLRERLSRPEYHVIAKEMGWARKKTIATPQLATDHPELDDDIPF
jgi:hypothetical protein